MENITDSLSNNKLFSSNSDFSEPSSNNIGFFDGFKNINITTWIVIILILAFLGFNIFTYLEKGTQDITNFFAPILKNVFGITVGVVGEVVDVSAEGAKKVVSGTADVLESGLTSIQDITPQGAKSSIKGQSVNQEQQPPSQNIQQSTLNKALNSSSQQSQQQDYQAMEASSSVNASSGKAGWCFVGLDRGIRTCAEVGVNDTCMSGDIFPSQEICMNPNLRP
jgi:hypothetical protein